MLRLQRFRKTLVRKAFSGKMAGLDTPDAALRAQSYPARPGQPPSSTTLSRGFTGKAEMEAEEPFVFRKQRKGCQVTEDRRQILQSVLDEDNFKKLMYLDNPTLHTFVAESIELCKPESVFVCSDSDEDISFIRDLAVKNSEEKALNIDGHTIHFDGPADQGRDKGATRYLVRPSVDLGVSLNTIDKEEGLAEVKGFLAGSMAGRMMLVRFFSLGPTNSDFSISGVQLTDSAYVAHSEDLLYRLGYEQFKTLGASGDFFRVLHSAGKLENNVSIEIDKRRIYIDLDGETVYSVNTQYAGNTVGFKKLSLRLAIRRAHRERWLAEHMFVMGVHGQDERVTYFTGAYPSACGKTSTAMIQGETIIGDDIAYLRRKHGRVHAVNVESGIFGIIRDVNEKDDPLIWDVLHRPGEVIFSNVLDVNGSPRWLSDGRAEPEKGVNFQGEWHKGMSDSDGKPVPLAHPNSRYTFRLSELKNLDPRADDPEGVPVGGIIYGGRDSDTTMPAVESFTWFHGVVTMGACLESETTTATIGATGVRAFQPMANLDFVSILLGKYIQSHLELTAGIERQPVIFSTNYFIRDENGDYITGMKDKNVWLKWMELRVHGDVEAIHTPVGFIPRYDDLAGLFKRVLDRDYTREEYEKAFTLRIPQYLEKIKRMVRTWRDDVPETPDILFDILAEQQERIEEALAKYGEYVSPFTLEAEPPEEE